jgi:CheY-like chemotaxis protein
VSERTGESTQAGFSPCRILVVEDDPSTASFLTQTLENEGYLVRHAPDGFQAVETARVQPPDLITMDIMMPVMDGRQAIAVLRRDDHLAGIPIVAVSVLAESGEAGADAALGKPVDHDKLLETVEFLLHGSSCRRPCVALDDGGLPPVELAGLFVGPVARYDEAEFWERMDAGFAGTIIISSQRIDDPRVVELAGSGRVQMVVLPVREQ